MEKYSHVLVSDVGHRARSSSPKTVQPVISVVFVLLAVVELTVKKKLQWHRHSEKSLPRGWSSQRCSLGRRDENNRLGG